MKRQGDVRHRTTAFDMQFFVDAREEAMDRHGLPEIFNPDQGRRFRVGQYPALWISPTDTMVYCAVGRCSAAQ